MPRKVKRRSQDNSKDKDIKINMDDSVLQLAKLLRDGLANSSESRWCPQNPCKYSGKISEDPIRFINKLETQIEDAGIFKEEISEFIEERLIGEAKKWFEPLAQLNMSWESFKLRFYEKFNGPNAKTRLKSRS